MTLRLPSREGVDMMPSVDVARTHEILARYRPIAPKPPLLENALPTTGEMPAAVAGGVRLPSRTPRARKRGRGSCSVVSQKRSRTYVPVLPSPMDASCQATKLGLAVRGFAHGFPVFPPFPGAGLSGSGEKTRGGNGGSGSCSDLLTLSLLPSSSTTPASSEADKEANEKAKAKALDLNTEPATAPMEKDLLGGLQKANNVIVPHPVRPVGSSISVGFISEGASAVHTAPMPKKPEEVEEEVESEALPAVVSDSSNRVRMANSAYKEMVGQPECPWLDSMVTSSRAGSRMASERISGEVMLDFSEARVPASANGFSCRVKIEWACNGQKTLLSAPCDVVRLSCKSKDYLFTWRFRTTEASVTSCKS